MSQEWYFFVDIVGSSNPNIKLNTQIEKIKKLVQIIKDFLLTHPELYKSFTGDGMLIVFPNYQHALDLAIQSSFKIQEYNKTIQSSYEEELHVRIGIGTGTSDHFEDGVHDQLAPWGANLINARRIMDFANADQILLTAFAFHLIEDVDNDVIYKKNLHDMGEVYFKHQTDPHRVYSFCDSGNFGNNLKIDANFDIQKILMSIQVENKLRRPLLKFCEKRAENSIYDLRGIMSESGLDLPDNNTNLLYEVIFTHTERYVSASFLPPGQFWNAYSGNPYRLLEYHADLLNRTKKNGIKGKNYRFLIVSNDDIKKDKRRNSGSYDHFVQWHKMHEVDLYLVDPIEFKKLSFERRKIVGATAIGLCYDLCLMQFGKSEKYISERYRNHPVVKRKFWLSDSTTLPYAEAKTLFDELKSLAENTELIRIDQG